jgi:hypothetical protein
MSRPKKQPTSISADAPNINEPETITEKASMPSKKVIHLMLDAGRSSIKYQAFINNETGTTPVMKTESLVCCVPSVPFGELGAFSLSRGKDENNKDITEHWVVGSSARLQGKEYIAMSDSENYKVHYFPILALGAIASLPNLLELSTGTSAKRRTLHIRLSTLSLASPLELKKAIEQCKWIAVDGVRYRLCFSKLGFLGFPEGYGASLWASERFDDKQFHTFDIGYGTATISEYSNLGKLPKRVTCSPNGGGGVATLIKEFSRALSNTDSSKMIRPSQLREILETATVGDNGISAIAPDGEDIGSELENAIHSWMKDSPLAYALDDISVKARRSKVTLCGGAFAIPPVQMLIKERLLKSCIPESNLLIPENPGTVALSEMKKLYLGETTDVKQAA